MCLRVVHIRVYCLVYVGRMLIVGRCSYVSDMFVVTCFQVATCLANIRVVACLAFQSVDSWFVVWWDCCLSNCLG